MIGQSLAIGATDETAKREFGALRRFNGKANPGPEPDRGAINFRRGGVLGDRRSRLE